MTFGYTDPCEQVQPPAGFPGAQGPYPFPVPHGADSGGPLAGMQDSIAGVLNASQNDYVYIPTGDSNPIIPVPRRFPPAMYRRDYAHVGQPARLSTGAKLFLLGWVLTFLTAIGLNQAVPALDPGRDLGIAAFVAGPVLGLVLVLLHRISRRGRS